MKINGAGVADIPGLITALRRFYAELYGIAFERVVVMLVEVQVNRRRSVQLEGNVSCMVATGKVGESITNATSASTIAAAQSSLQTVVPGATFTVIASAAPAQPTSSSGLFMAHDFEIISHNFINHLTI